MSFTPKDAWAHPSSERGNWHGKGKVTEMRPSLQPQSSSPTALGRFLPNKHSPGSPGPLFHSEGLGRKELALQSMAPGFHLATSKLAFGKLTICQQWSFCVFRKLPIVAACYYWPSLQSPSMELSPTLPPSPEVLLGANKGVKTRASLLLLDLEQVASLWRVFAVSGRLISLCPHSQGVGPTERAQYWASLGFISLSSSFSFVRPLR